MTSATFSVLRRQAMFMRLWYARLFGTAANQMLMVALGWQMYELTGNAWDLGLVGLYQFLPGLLLVLVAGHAADRVHRGHIIVSCMVVQAIVAATLMLGSAGVGASHSWITREALLLLSVVLGAARAFQMPAQQALTPLMVPAALLPQAMAFSSVGMQVAVIGGPALGGVIYAAGAQAVYAVCLLSFAGGAFLISRVRFTQAPPAREPVTLRTVLAGASYVWHHKTILGAISLDLFAVLLGGATALLPIFARDILHAGPWGLGLLRSAPAVGALVMSLWLMRRPLKRHVGRTLLLAVAVFGLCMVVFGLSTWFWLSLVALAVSGAADMVSVVIRMTLIQLETPDAMRGRVSAVGAVFVGASNELGEFESGALAAWLGPVASVVLGGVGTIVVAACWRQMFPALRRRDRLG